MWTPSVDGVNQMNTNKKTRFPDTPFFHAKRSCTWRYTTTCLLTVPGGQPPFYGRLLRLFFFFCLLFSSFNKQMQCWKSPFWQLWMSAQNIRLRRRFELFAVPKLTWLCLKSSSPDE
jgi:hypothetical protein